MAQYSFPFSGTTTGDAGPYSADFFAQFMSELFAQLTRDNAGVLQNRNDGVNASLDVTVTSPASAAVELQVGSALVQGYYYVNDAALTLTIDANNDGSGFDRIDLIVLEIDYTNQTIRAGVVKGTAASSPVAPTVTQNASIYQIPLATVDVPNLFISITTGIDNTVRSYAQLLDWREGGTGYNSYGVRQVLVGQTDGSLDIEYFSEASVVFDGTGTTFAGGSWQTTELIEDRDPDNLITVSSNQITVIKSGWYSWYQEATIVSITNALQLVHRIRNITGGATLSIVGPSYLAAALAASRSTAISRPFELAANTVIELQNFNVAGSTHRYINDASPAGSGETHLALIGRLIRWGNS